MPLVTYVHGTILTLETFPSATYAFISLTNSISPEHNYMLVGASGGCCDCGDEDAWKTGGFVLLLIRSFTHSLFYLLIAS